MGNVPITSRMLYSREDNKTPLKNGPLDPRLGTNEAHPCETCGLGKVECPGHFGFLQLALPVFHVGFFRHTIQILQCICKTCSRVLLVEEKRKDHLKRAARNVDLPTNLRLVKSVVEDCKKMKTCVHCGALNGTVKKKPNDVLKITHARFNTTKEHEL